MQTLRTETVRVEGMSQTVALRKRTNDMFPDGGQWMYTIEDADTNDRFGDPETRKQPAVDRFNRTIEDIQRGMRSSAEESSMDFLPYF